MKKTVKILLSVLCLAAGFQPALAQHATLVFDTNEANDTYPYVVCGQQHVKTKADASGKRTATLDMTQPAYVTVYFSKLNTQLCYAEPGKKLVLTYQMPAGSKSLTFGGDLARENKYLQTMRWSGAIPFSRNMTLHDYVAKNDSLTKLDIARMEQEKLPATFRQWEQKRIETQALERLLRIHTKDTTAYLSLLANKVVKDAEWLRIPKYLYVADQYIRLLTRLTTPGGKLTEGEELADRRIACIKQYVHQPDVAGYLVDITLFHLAELNLPRYNEVYHQYVKDSKRLAAYDAATRKAAGMAKGAPCPDFCFADNKGGKVRLADLRGKFVYIDLWATWCGPCKGEMPALLALEKQFEGKDILFVSLSVDTNKHVELWKKTITQMGLGGIQLHLGEQWDWLKTFMPSSMSVPRFILLDREGRIIDAHAPRPSDKTIATRLEQLLAETEGK